ncbi:carbonic anhydrase [Streptomyces pacificus]|uniref:carbonic anhydrase n=1 Tax=Streptomyces pacificus TaxID=2705029 RepID=UPI0015662010|nr:carbonic anhydrase [Streptomyces pacificus]
MNDLLERARSFRQRIVRDRGYYRSLAAGQAPAALFITCSDSRVVPCLITDAHPGELFELRTAGHVVPSYTAEARCAEAATIEYAVDVLRVRDVIVCGHSHCGAVAALARGEDLSTLPSVATWLESSRPALSSLRGAAPDDAELEAHVQCHVAAQVEALRGYPQIERAVAAGRLGLHAWYYRVDTGEVKEITAVFGDPRRR